MKETPWTCTSVSWRTPLVEIEQVERSVISIRTAMVLNALSVVGVEAGDRESRPIFDQLLGPPIGWWGLDKPFGQGGPSTCSMVAQGLLRRLGVASVEVMGGYKAGAGLSTVRKYAQSIVPNAWVRPLGSVRPKRGDIIDLRPKAGAVDLSNHSEVVLGFDGDEIVCVAGGQVGVRNLQAIKLVRRRWQEKVGQATSCATATGVRVVDGWVDIGLLRYDGRLVVPEGWSRWLV